MEQAGMGVGIGASAVKGFENPATLIG